MQCLLLLNGHKIPHWGSAEVLLLLFLKCTISNQMSSRKAQPLILLFGKDGSKCGLNVSAAKVHNLHFNFFATVSFLRPKQHRGAKIRKAAEPESPVYGPGCCGDDRPPPAQHLLKAAAPEEARNRKSRSSRDEINSAKTADTLERNASRFQRSYERKESGSTSPEKPNFCQTADSVCDRKLLLLLLQMWAWWRSADADVDAPQPRLSPHPLSL